MKLERRSWAEPFKIKVVERVRMTSREQRLPTTSARLVLEVS